MRSSVYLVGLEEVEGYSWIFIGGSTWFEFILSAIKMFRAEWRNGTLGAPWAETWAPWGPRNTVEILINYSSLKKARIGIFSVWCSFSLAQSRLNPGLLLNSICRTLVTLHSRRCKIVCQRGYLGFLRPYTLRYYNMYALSSLPYHLYSAVSLLHIFYGNPMIIPHVLAFFSGDMLVRSQQDLCSSTNRTPGNLTPVHSLFSKQVMSNAKIHIDYAHVGALPIKAKNVKETYSTVKILWRWNDSQVLIGRNFHTHTTPIL